jgi:hypothetical protein
MDNQSVQMDDASVQMEHRFVQMGDQSIQMDDKSIQMNDTSVQMNDASVSMNDSFESKNAFFLLPGNGVVLFGSRANDCNDCPGSLGRVFYRVVHASHKKDSAPVTAKNFNLKAIL